MSDSLKIEDISRDKMRNALDALEHLHQLMNDISASNKCRIPKDQVQRLKWAHTFFNVIKEQIKNPFKEI